MNGLGKILPLFVVVLLVLSIASVALFSTDSPDDDDDDDDNIIIETPPADFDGDGLIDEKDADDDDDGYLDSWEEALGTNPKDEGDKPVDTDNDGKPDGDAENSEDWMDTGDLLDCHFVGVWIEGACRPAAGPGQSGRDPSGIR